MMAKNNAFENKFRKIDLYSQRIGFRVNGNDSLGSIFGACISLVMITIVATYGFHKFLVMKNYDDTRFNEYVGKNELLNHEL